MDKSRIEIERLIHRYKADQFGSAIDNEHKRTMIQFRIGGILVRFEMDLPSGEQQLRQRWRALLLVLKAKLEAVECGITTFESEFLAHVVMGDGQTFGKWALPQLADMRKSGQMPKSLMPPRLEEKATK